MDGSDREVEGVWISLETRHVLTELFWHQGDGNGGTNENCRFIETAAHVSGALDSGCETASPNFFYANCEHNGKEASFKYSNRVI